MDPLPAPEKYVWLYAVETFSGFAAWARCPDWVDERLGEKLRVNAKGSKMIFGAFDDVMQSFIDYENHNRHLRPTASLTWKIIERSQEHSGSRVVLSNHKRSIFLHLVFAKESEEHAYLRPPPPHAAVW